MFARRLATSLAALLVLGCASQRRDWAFVQSVGGLAVGAPYRTAAGVSLPVTVDVSGLRAITTRPTAMNSGLALKGIAVRREDHALALALTTALATSGERRTTSPDLELGALEPGRYTVVYAEPGGERVELGAIEVP